MFIEAVDPLWWRRLHRATDLDRPVRLDCFVETDRAGARHGRVHGRSPGPKARNFFQDLLSLLSSLVLDPVLY